MKALIIYSHPVEGSFCSAIRDAAAEGFRQAGHNIDVIDLTAENFNPVMSADEWDLYFSSNGQVPQGLERHVELVKEADFLCFVYPTWWSGLPAQLKGWIERIMIFGVGFTLNKNNKVRPALRNVRKIYVLSTFGSPRWYVRFINDNGRRVLSRALRLSTGRASLHSMGLYAMDTQTEENRREFLAKVTQKLAQS
jgi:putative NADPH-quinone reductase